MTKQLSNQWNITLADEPATRQLGYRLGQLATVGTVLLLDGDLGSGKTTLVQGLGQALGVTEPIVSPTFTLVCEYLEARIPLYHLDLYRLQPEEITSLDLEAYWQGIEYLPGVVAIEWAERLQHLPPDYLQISLRAEQITDADSSNHEGRQASFTAIGTAQSLLAQLAAEIA